jgi:hypothetical protein
VSLDARALGVIAFRALTGTLPERYPTAPPDLASLVDHLLATDPAPGRPPRRCATAHAGSPRPSSCGRSSGPPRGLNQESIPVIGIEESSELTIHIGRKP